MFDAFTYYGDTGRWRVSCDDAGTVTATDLLPGNGLFARDGETLAIGTITEGDGRDDAPFIAANEWGVIGFDDARAAASHLIGCHDDARADACEGAA